MRKILLTSVLALALFTNLNAYELDGKLDVKFTGFKSAKKVGVSGTFKTIKLDIKKSAKLADFLKSSNVEIDALSVDTKMAFRDKNITSTLFSLASAKTIMGSISSVKGDDKKGTLSLKLTMNKVTKEVPMTYMVDAGKIMVKGSVEILDFALNDSFAAFALKCKAFHQNKTYSDVALEFTIPYK